MLKPSEFNACTAIGEIIPPTPEERRQKVSVVFEKSSWRVSLVVIVAAILGTIQEVICRRAAHSSIQLGSSRTKTSTSEWNMEAALAGRARGTF